MRPTSKQQKAKREFKKAYICNTKRKIKGYNWKKAQDLYFGRLHRYQGFIGGKFRVRQFLEAPHY